MRIDGKPIAANLLANLKTRTSSLSAKGVIPKLAVILVGLDQASVSYVNQKEKTGAQIGAVTRILRYPTTVKQQGLEYAIGDLNGDRTVHGIIVQQPLPAHIDVASIIQTITADKDVDGFRTDSPFTPPIALAVAAVLNYIHQEKMNQSKNFTSWLAEQQICVLGRGLTGGKPIAEYFKKKAHLTVIHSQTENVTSLTQTADIIITAVGKRGVLTNHMIKDGVILINIGMHRESEKLQGDYVEGDIGGKAAFYTPTPGGVGPVNVACLWENVISAAEK